MKKSIVLENVEIALNQIKVNKMKKPDINKRRNFILSSLRIAAMGLFGFMVFHSVKKNKRLIRENKCVNRGLCCNCQIFSNCSLPQALSAKGVLEKNQNTKSIEPG